MNKYLIIGCFVALILVPVVRWQYSKRSGDAELRERLLGTWTVTAGTRVFGTITLAPDGRFTDDLEFAKSEGTYRVRNGLLVKTTAQTGDTNVPAPIISRARIGIQHASGTNLVMILDSLDSKGKYVRPLQTQYWKGTPFFSSADLTN